MTDAERNLTEALDRANTKLWLLDRELSHQYGEIFRLRAELDHARAVGQFMAGCNGRRVVFVMEKPS